MQLEKLRADKGLSQKQLSKATGVAQATISDIESGKTQHPRIDTLLLIARGLRVSIDELLNCEFTA